MIALCIILPEIIERVAVTVFLIIQSRCRIRQESSINLGTCTCHISCLLVKYLLFLKFINAKENYEHFLIVKGTCILSHLRVLDEILRIIANKIF